MIYKVKRIGSTLLDNTPFAEIVAEQASVAEESKKPTASVRSEVRVPRPKMEKLPPITSSLLPVIVARESNSPLPDIATEGMEDR